MFARKNCVLVFFLLASFNSDGQHSIARAWNEVLLEAIRNDFARPTVHARNLFHVSAVMYDAWAAYDEDAEPYFLGKSHGGYHFEFNGVVNEMDITKAQEEAMSYACYRLLHHRFLKSPGYETTSDLIDSLFSLLGYDPSIISRDYEHGSPASLGNYLASQVIEFGLQDGSSEQHDYVNLYYFPVNTPLNPEQSGSQGIQDPNRWQPLAFESFIDQSGNPIPGSAPPFLGPEWGRTRPFSLQESDLAIYERDGYDFWVYHDPGLPVLLNDTDKSDSENYIWNHSMVVKWSSHLDPTNDVHWDISPGGLGNLSIEEFPQNNQELASFYNEIAGGDYSTGRTINPSTGLPYSEQLVSRGDYARVLAEFWADGPDSETPPGHWFTLLNYVSDHPLTEKKYRGRGEELSDFEWDIKSYFLLGGAMHDAAISAWGIKGYYDYIRPISAIRSMAERGQSTNEDMANFHPWGIELEDGLIEIVQDGDALAGEKMENIGKIKVFAWKGPDYIEDETIDFAGVGWILAENWWPYQRPTFVTPPFAGYVSGHSTYSRAAAEVLTLFTGDEYFPGGMGEFLAKKNEFLVFEEGPSQDVVLQWATYRDASDQCSLSRIWGGIHPPVDDIPGRLIGEKIGKRAFHFGSNYFGLVLDLNNELVANPKFYPNPVSQGQSISLEHPEVFNQYTIFDLAGHEIYHSGIINSNNFLIDVTPGVYLLEISGDQSSFLDKIIVTH
ncbi:MAG: T9SS type A sorting domain-containing protein [Reichenbachiella sp.]